MIGLFDWMQDGQDLTEWANQQHIHPVALMMIVLLSFAMLVVRRRWALGPFIVVIGFITVAQRFVIAGLDFPMLRILVFVGWLRIIMRNELAGFQFRTLDVLVLAWSASRLCTHLALTATTSPGALGGVLIFECGWLVDNVGAYFLFRALMRGWKDLEAVVKLMALLVVPIALFFLVEKATGRNLFSVFGRVPEFTGIREGKLRCQGSFTHPILAGCFWAGMLPLFAGLSWSRPPTKGLSAAAVLCALVIVVCCASSTPVMGALVVVLGVLMFPARGYLRLVQIGIPALLLGLHLCMKAPVWHLISRIDPVGGSSGYHRYKLIDQAIRNFDEWWLVGTGSTAHWGWGMDDLTNYYVLQAVQGGLSTLVLLVAVVVVAFRSVGRILRLNTLDRNRYVMAWLLGVSLLAHCAMLMAVSYVHKPQLLWTLMLAVVSSLELRSIAVARRRAVLAVRAQGELATQSS